MSRKEIFIIRHGQTDNNKLGIVQGRGVNLPLNELGRKQANLFYENFRNEGFDVVYTSTLLRAQESVKQFIEDGLKHEIRSEIDEISWGIFEGNKSLTEQSDDFKNLLKSWDEGQLHKKPEGGESPIELQQRQLPFVEELKKIDDKKILVCMHGRAMRSLLCTLTETPLKCMSDFEHVNLTLYKLSLNEYGKFSVDLHNDSTHLKDL